MLGSFVRVLAIVLAFTCGVAQAGLVIFDSTNGLDTATRTILDDNDNRLNQSQGVAFTVAEGVSFSLQSATFGVRLLPDPAATQTLNFTVSLVQGSQELASTATNFNLLSGATNVVAFNLGGAAPWNVSQGSYRLELSYSGTGGATNYYIAGTGLTNAPPPSQFVTNLVSFDNFFNANSPSQDNYWVQFTANSASVVPEPATIGLLIGGLGIGLGRQIRRRSRKAATSGAASKSATTFGNSLRRLKAAFSR